MIDLYFEVTSQNFLHRIDSKLIKNQQDEEYICHFTFENEDWDDKQKFVTFSVKKNFLVLRYEPCDLSIISVCDSRPH